MIDSHAIHSASGWVDKGMTDLATPHTLRTSVIRFVIAFSQTERASKLLICMLR